MQSEVPQPGGDPFVAARQPLIRPIRKRIGHLLREGEGFRIAKRLRLLVGDPSTILLRKIASGTAQDDSGKLFVKVTFDAGATVAILSNVSFGALSPSANTLIRPIRKRIGHLPHKGEGFHGAKRLCLLVRDPSTKPLRGFAYGTAQDDSGRRQRAHTRVRPYVV